MKKIILLIVAFIVLALVGLGLWAYFAFLYTKPLSKAELAELTPDWSAVTHGNWSPWFTQADGSQTWNPAASFNAWLATVPEEDKAWPIFVDVQWAGSALYNNMDVGGFPEDTEDWPALVEVCSLQESRLLIEQIKIALQKPVMGAQLYDASIPGMNMNYTRDPVEFAAMEMHDVEDREFVQSTNPNIDILSARLPGLGKQRGFANIVRTYAIYELERGNVDEFIELTVISMDSAELAVELPTLISQLVAISIEDSGVKTIEWALKHHAQAFSDEQLVVLDQLVARHQDRTFIWQGEAIGFHDTIRRMVNDNGALKGSGLRTLQGGGASFDLPTNLTDAQLHASTQRTLYVYSQVLKQVEVESDLPLQINGLSSTQIFSQMRGDLNRMSQLLLDILAPSLENASSSFRRLQEECLDARWLIASQRHALRHGQLPASNEDIDEDLLPD